VSAPDLVNGIIVAGLTSGSLYALVALGFNVLWRTTRVLNFAHGDLIMWAPMGALVAYDLLHLPALASLGIGIVVPVVFGLASERVAIRPYQSQPHSHAWILSTLGTSLVLEQLAAQPFQAQSMAFPLALSAKPLEVGVMLITPQQLLLIAMAAIAVFGVHLIYVRTRFGRRLLAAGEDPQGAAVLGISRARMSQVAMTLSALTAAVTGLMVAPLLLVYPTFGFGLVFGGFVAMAIGGMGSIRGSIVGGALVGILAQVTAVFIGSLWSNAILFGFLLLLYLIRPQGLFGVRAVRAV
jgi:branched-chain amino acid transport system permease protein